jgi:hypothetical protein
MVEYDGAAEGAHVWSRVGGDEGRRIVPRVQQGLHNDHPQAPLPQASVDTWCTLIALVPGALWMDRRTQRGHATHASARRLAQ